MSEAEKSVPSLIPNFDDAFYEEEAIKQDLHDAGFSDNDQKWLVAFFKRPGTFGNPNSGFTFREYFEEELKKVLEAVVTGEVKIEKDRQTSLALLFSLMLDCGPRFNILQPNDKFDASSDSLSHPEWISEFQRHAKFCAQTLGWDELIELKNSNRASLNFHDLVRFIFFPEVVPLNQIIDLDRLNPIRRSGWSSNDFEDSSDLEFWLKWRFEDNENRRDTIRLDTLLLPFSNFPEDVLGEKVLGLLNAINAAMTIGYALSSERLNPMGDGWRVVAHELLPFLGLITAKEPDSSKGRSSLLKAWWRLARVIYGWDMGGLESELSPELRNRIVESAARHIGILRSVLRDKPEIFAEEEDENSAGSVADFYQHAFHILLTLAPPWKCLKPLLLAFTEMTEQAVTSDLRAWNELGREEKLPYPYSEVALWIAMTLYPQNLQKELDRDPNLQDLRQEFAKFSLGRLKTKGKTGTFIEDKQFTDEDFVEPRTFWRQGYVQALAVLRVNPSGRAHRTVFWLSQNDPDETIRELAKRAHKQIRHLDRKKPNLHEGASPRRPLFEAFFWLRQAHLLTLGVEIDEAGAMRTRRRELHRTREKDDRHDWGRAR